MTEKVSRLGTIVRIVSGRADPTPPKGVSASLEDLEDRMDSLERKLTSLERLVRE